jgi:hypothetical protein
VAVVGHLRRGDAEVLATVAPPDRAPLERVDLWYVDEDADPEVMDAVAAPPPRRFRTRSGIPHERLGPADRALSRRDRRALLEAELGVPTGADLVCSGGHVDFWHHTDVFLQACWTIRGLRPDRDTHFVWLAERSSDRMLWPLRHDIAHAALDRHVHVLERDPPRLLDLAAAADVFMRTNRQVPAPEHFGDLPVLGTPTVAFARDEDATADVVVPWMDVDRLAREVVGLLDDEPARSRCGQPPAEEAVTWDPRVAPRALARRLEAFAV